ncbi:MAG: hypothetical protein ACTSXP_06760 [Promethearchaeota archaeon]
MNIDEFFLENLLKWFKKNHRDFPWRNNDLNPFVLLITELLLQRTKAEAIASFYPVLLEKYSSPEQVLERDDKEILEDLSVLGLQKRRTVALISISKTIIEKFDGNVPKSEKKLLTLKGVGRYIARAVLCFAFNKPYSIVDGNVTRVFCRFFDLENKGDNRRNKHIWERGDEILRLQPENAKSINWAILDLAALICLPRKPRCGDCPVVERCAFFIKWNNQYNSNK